MKILNRNKMKKIKIAMSSLLVMLATTAFAQSPSWSVNPNSYQYNMTVIAVLEVNCEELADSTNKLAAYVDDTLRGVANTSNVVNGRYLVTMSVYSQQASGETVSFRFYDEKTDSIYYSIDSVAFQEDAVYGSLRVPFTVKTRNAPSGLTLSNDSILENQSIGQLIGQFKTNEADNNQNYTYDFVSGAETNDNGFFSINGDQLIANFTADYEVQSTYLIHVKTTDDIGCSYDSLMTIYVKKSGERNTNIGNESSSLDNANTYISPNGDGYNDYWQLQNVHQYSDYKLTIFSTNGEIVFEKKSNYHNEWDGTSNGKPLAEGVYYYILQDNKSSQNTFKGTITLKR